ncbi:MAG: FAD-dependent thymidylate synthase [Clostridiales bacterium]|nr:FAD-dependent thymidylate synthase [Clostridiales bacterium]
MQVTPKVSLIRYTADPEATVALAAKLCYSDRELPDLAENILANDNSAFIARLTEMGHLSPIEHASFTFSVEGVSRAFLAQITRHRIASFSVRSQRYVSEDSFNYVVPPAIEDLGAAAVARYVGQMDTIMDWYRDWQSALGRGEKSNEDARFILPNACETKMIVTMNARELMHFFELRCCNRAQWEIRSVAWLMLAEVLKVAPNLFKDCGPGCLRGGCPEGVKSCGKRDEVIAKKQALVDAAEKCAKACAKKANKK